MKTYMIVAALISCNIICAMDYTLDGVIITLNHSMYRAIDTQKTLPKKEKINHVLMVDENGKKILEAYDKASLTKQRFNMRNIFKRSRL